MTHRKLFILSLSFVVLFVLAGCQSATATPTPEPTATVASNELTQTATRSDGNLSVDYPAGWIADEQLGFIILTNNEEALTAEADALPDGAILITVLQHPIELSEEVTLEAVLDEFIDNQAGSVGGLTITNWNGKDARQRSITYDNYYQLVIMVDVDGSLVQLLASGKQADISSFYPTLQEIGGSITLQRDE